MKNNLGFLKRSSEFRKNSENEKYFPILDQLYSVSMKHHNNLPTFFSLTNLSGFSREEVQSTLSILYPERNYCCYRVNTSIIYCVNS